MIYYAVVKIDNDILLKGHTCCTSLQELYVALTDPETTEIVITKGFTELYFTYTALCDFVEYSASIVPHIRIVVEDEVYDATVKNVRELMLYRSVDEFVYALEKNPDKFLSTISALCKSYMTAHDEVSAANNKLATVLMQVEELNKALDYSKSDYAKLLESKNDVESKLHSIVSRVNFKYEKTLNPDELFVCEHNNYNHILYLKEVTRVHYTDTLLYYLQEILKTLYSVPVRTVVIEPYYSYGRSSMYPTLKPHWDLTYHDVYAGDIYMAGFQSKVMKDVLQNPNHVNFLIVLDRGGYAYEHVKGANVSTVYVASDTKDLPEDADISKCITYEENSLYIPYIENFDELSPEEKVQKYSSMDVTKELIKLLEEVI